MQVALIAKQVPLESPALRRAIIWAAFLFLLLVSAHRFGRVAAICQRPHFALPAFGQSQPL